MDFRVEITNPAIADLTEIVSYIARDNPEAAIALGNHLLLDTAIEPKAGATQRQRVSQARKHS